MKVIVPIILLALITITNNHRYTELANRISTVESQNRMLGDSVLYIQANFIKPMKAYERIVFEEITRSPEETISDYRDLIKKYPNSLWEDEAKKRIESVQEKVQYWQNLEGYSLPMFEFKPNAIELIEYPLDVECSDCKYKIFKHMYNRLELYKLMVKKYVSYLLFLFCLGCGSSQEEEIVEERIEFYTSETINEIHNLIRTVILNEELHIDKFKKPILFQTLPRYINRSVEGPILLPPPSPAMFPDLEYIYHRHNFDLSKEDIDYINLQEKHTKDINILEELIDIDNLEIGQIFDDNYYRLRFSIPVFNHDHSLAYLHIAITAQCHSTSAVLWQKKNGLWSAIL